MFSPRCHFTVLHSLQSSLALRKRGHWWKKMVSVSISATTMGSNVHNKKQERKNKKRWSRSFLFFWYRFMLWNICIFAFPNEPTFVKKSATFLTLEITPKTFSGQKNRWSRTRNFYYIENFAIPIGCPHSTEVALLRCTQRLRVWYMAFAKIYLKNAEIYQQCWLEESRQRLENVHRTHLVLASG